MESDEIRTFPVIGQLDAVETLISEDCCELLKVVGLLLLPVKGSVVDLRGGLRRDFG